MGTRWWQRWVLGCGWGWKQLIWRLWRQEGYTYSSYPHS